MKAVGSSLGTPMRSGLRPDGTATLDSVNGRSPWFLPDGGASAKRTARLWKWGRGMGR